MKRITLEEAKARADEWKWRRDERDREPNAAYFSDATAYDLIAMWQSGKNLDGRKLTRREFGCLIERWVEVFGDLPANRDDAVDNDDTTSAVTPPIPLPADDTMLRVEDVVRLTGLSHSTIKRMVSDGRFPKPLRIGERAKGWQMRDVQEWIDQLNEQRRRPRQ